MHNTIREGVVISLILPLLICRTIWNFPCVSSYCATSSGWLNFHMWKSFSNFKEWQRQKAVWERYARHSFWAKCDHFTRSCYQFKTSRQHMTACVRHVPVISTEQVMKCPYKVKYHQIWNLYYEVSSLKDQKQSNKSLWFLNIYIYFNLSSLCDHFNLGINLIVEHHKMCCSKWTFKYNTSNTICTKKLP